MGTTEKYWHQHAIEEIRETIPHDLKMLDEEIDQEHDPDGNLENVHQYADAMSSLVFDAIENAMFWTERVNELEAFRNKIHDAIDVLDVAIAVWKRSEGKGAERSRQIPKHHH